MNENRFIIAAAGSGKTTFLVHEALKHRDGRILITTFTEANEQEIRKKFIKLNRCIPANVTVQTWFSFLLQHGAKPYQGCKTNIGINGLVLVNGQSTNHIPEANVSKHYFTEDGKIFSDKLAKFAVKCNEYTRGAVIDRLSRIYSKIFIDEVQDLAGYDLELLKLLLQCRTELVLVGDPRQGIFATNAAPKYKQYRRTAIVSFFADDSISISTDSTSLTTNFRSGAAICDLADKLFPEHSKTASGNAIVTGHDGVFLVRRSDIPLYLSTFKPMQLRDNIKTNVDGGHSVMNFGRSKGLEFDRVLVYPTKPIIAWLKDNHSVLQPISRAKLYVALTRARYSVALVCDEEMEIEGIERFNPIESNKAKPQAAA